jgi:glycosyltransferase involved in cell wall biosynthesis
MEHQPLPLLSVILPIYNAALYLPTCIESILKQTYPYFELIIINDGSTDPSGKICDQYAAADARVKVQHQANRGVSFARNLGLSSALGQYITFCDADDWLQEQFFMALMQNPEQDLVIGSYYNFVKEHFDQVTLPALLLDNKIDIGLFLQKHLALFPVCFSSPWGKRYSRQIIEAHNLRFDVLISSGEDTLWVFDYYLHTASLSILPFAGYYYRQYYAETQLSATPLDKLTIDYTIKSLFDKIDRMEAELGQSFSDCRYNVLLTYFLKFTGYVRSGSLLQVRKKIIRLSVDTYFSALWQDRRFVVKGERRKIFDRLILSRNFMMLAIYAKLIKQIY